MCTLAILRRSETVPAYLIRKAKTLCDLVMISYRRTGHQVRDVGSSREFEYEFVRRHPIPDLVADSLVGTIVIRAVCFRCASHS